MELRRAHAVLLPFPGQGHTRPMMRLACKLVGVGVRITVIAPSDSFNTEIGSLDAGLLVESLRVLEIPPAPAQPPSEEAARSTFVVLENALRFAAPMEERLRSLIVEEGETIDCLIADSFLPFAHGIAERLRITRAVLWTASACSAIPNFRIRDLTEADRAEGNVPFALLAPPPLDLELRIEVGERAKQAQCLLLSTFEELEGESISKLKLQQQFVYPVGPLILAEGAKPATGKWQEDRECLQWLDEQQPRSVVFIAFGSIASLSASQLEELAMGIEASGAPFLWVMRADLVPDCSGEDLKSFAQRMQAQNRGKIISWAPQVEVLAHPATSIFLTHCGWNSTMESICNGVPLLAWPCFAEQNVNAKFIAEVWNVGVAFEGAMRSPGGFVHRTEVERTIRKGLSDERIRSNVTRLKDESQRSSSSLQDFAAKFLAKT